MHYEHQDAKIPKGKFKSEQKKKPILPQNHNSKINKNSYKNQFQRKKLFLNYEILNFPKIQSRSPDYKRHNTKDKSPQQEEDQKENKLKKKPKSKAKIISNYINQANIKSNKIRLLPIRQKSLTPFTLAYKEYSYKENQNSEYRKQMEDFHKIVVQFIFSNSCSYFAIFDGHGGDTAAIYCKDNFDNIIKKSLQETKFDMNKSLINSFSKIDVDLNKTIKKDDCGSTATIVLIYKNKENNKRIITCANVGDSRCYLIKKSKMCIKLSTDHKCDDPNEVERIKKTGALIFNGRIYGSLIITRTIGDKEMKKYGVISTPAIRSVEVNDEEDQYVIIASDGVWDIVNEEKLKMLCEGELKAEKINEELVNMAIEGGSRDNVSCIVIKLN